MYFLETGSALLYFGCNTRLVAVKAMNGAGVMMLMPSVELREEERIPGQRVERLSLEGDTVRLEGRKVEIRFPSSWARKLLPWLRGPGRNILCNADLKRYNLMGATKMGEQVLLTYVDHKGKLRAERVSPGTIHALQGLLDSLG